MSETQRQNHSPLDPANILTILDQCLPKLAASNEEAGASPISSENVLLKSGQDSLAAVFHAIMLAVDFRFIGLGEEGTIETIPETQDHLAPLPQEWNANGPDSYAFRYKHAQSSLTFLVKDMRLANKFLVHGMGIEDNKISTLEIVTADYTSPAFFPYKAVDNQSEPLINAFISQSRLKDLISLYKINILQKLIPNLNKSGYEETVPTTTSTASTSARSRRPDPHDPLRHLPPVRPPIFDDPFAGDEPLRFENPYNVGRNDLDPLGLPRFGGGGIQPLGGLSRGGGMHVGLDHPMFGPRGPPHYGGIYGGPPLPRGSVPPGARFDPVGPFGQLNRGRGRGVQFSDPDSDELPPPGYNDMFM